MPSQDHLRRDHEPPSHAEEQLLATEWGESARPFFRILVVDDEPAFTWLVKKTLEADGRFEVHCENDSRNAVAACLHLKPDAVLLDVRMPNVDGEEVARQLKAHPSLHLTPVVMVSAHYPAPPEPGQDMLTEDGRLMLQKPTPARKLISCLQLEIQKALESISEWNEPNPWHLRVE